MKGRITTDGQLIVTAENDTEAFALSQWWKNYKGGDKKSTLSCEQLKIEKGEESREVIK